MKSSDESIGDLLKNYFRILYRPTETIGDITSRPVDLTNTFIIVIISSVLLIAGVFIVSDAVYTTFHFYAYSYPLEQITSGQVFGYILPFDNINYYGLVFLTDIIFCIKAWLFLSVLMIGFLKLFKQQLSIKRTAQMIAWSIFPLGIVMFVGSLICLGFKYLLPEIYYLIYFGILAAGFIVVAPVMIHLFLERFKGVSMYNAIRSYYLSLFVVFMILLINHPDKLLVSIW